MNFDEPREVLGITGRATLEDIGQAFHRMALRYDPDPYYDRYAKR